MQKLEFSRNIDSVLAQADENGIWIVCGWTLPIPKAQAIEYVKTYNTNPNSGFFEHNGNIVLSHNTGKITFSRQEGNAIVELIKAAYLS